MSEEADTQSSYESVINESESKNNGGKSSSETQRVIVAQPPMQVDEHIIIYDDEDSVEKEIKETRCNCCSFCGALCFIVLLSEVCCCANICTKKR